MSKKEEFEIFLENLQSCAMKEFQASKEYEYRQNQQQYFDKILTTNLNIDQKTLIEEILFEFCSLYEHEADLMYKQGIKDCVWILKTLGVIS